MFIISEKNFKRKVNEILDDRERTERAERLDETLQKMREISLKPKHKTQVPKKRCNDYIKTDDIENVMSKTLIDKMQEEIDKQKSIHDICLNDCTEIILNNDIVSLYNDDERFLLIKPINKIKFENFLEVYKILSDSAVEKK